jgi:photosystem II stability/assembly factor-like uncharacterized protein
MPMAGCEPPTTNNQRRPAVIVLALIPILLIASSSGDKSSHWQVIGPGGGGALFEPTISPQDPSRVLVACDMTGSYVTEDGGQAWKTFNLRGRVRWFVFDPNNKDVVYAKSIGLWRSTDGARTWRLLYPDPAKVSGISMPDDHASESLKTTEPTGSITALNVDPADSKTLFAVLQRGRTNQLVVSTNYGQSWNDIALLPEGVNRIYIDPHSPRQDRTLYLVAANSVLILEHGKWRQGPPPNAVKSFTQVSISFPTKAGPSAIYASTDTGIFVSHDGGSSWQASALPGTGARSNAVAAAPNHPEVAYVSFSGLKEGWFGRGRPHFGIARTTDSGKHWQLVWKESGQRASNIHDAWISEFFGPEYGGVALGLAVSETDSNIVYATDQGRIMRTRDAGRNWEAVYSTRQSADAFTGRGLEATTCYGVHFDPFDPKRVFISYTDIGLFGSENGGANWTASLTGVPHSWQNTTYWMVFDPDVKGRVWAVMTKTHDLPRTKMWRKRSPSSYDGGVMLSEDGARTWRKSNVGMAPTAATHIVLDPRSKPDARVLYVAAFGRGVYKSVDGGKSWVLKTNGISGAEPLAWRLALASSGDLYLVVVRRSDDGSIGNENDGAIYRSNDGAEHWTKVALPDGVNGPNGLTVDPRDSRRLYLAAWGRNTPPYAQGGGIFLSTDSGKTWRSVLSQDQHIYDVTIDPHNPRVLYAVGFESSAWRSADHGLTWKRIRGFNFKWGHRAIPDPVDTKKIYITTFGGGVWHGPSQGDSSAIDEIASPILAHGK